MKSFAVVPAGGQSTRMGRPKLALPIRGRSVIEHVVRALREGGVEKVLVVVGPHVPELTQPARAAGADVMILQDLTPDMRSTVERGLGLIEEQFQPAADDAWLLTPGDHPAFTSGVVRELLESARVSTSSIVVPVHGGRHGHPALLRWRHAAEIRALAPELGINRFMRERAGETVELHVADPGILANLDTLEDYARLSDHHF